MCSSYEGAKVDLNGKCQNSNDFYQRQQPRNTLPCHMSGGGRRKRRDSYFSFFKLYIFMNYYHSCFSTKMAKEEQMKGMPIDNLFAPS